jgi:hypothetical protein
MEQATAGSYSELVKSAKADGRTLAPRAEWVKMGKDGYLP